MERQGVSAVRFSERRHEEAVACAQQTPSVQIARQMELLTERESGNPFCTVPRFEGGVLPVALFENDIFQTPEEGRGKAYACAMV